LYNYGISFDVISFGSTIRCWRCFKILVWIVWFGLFTLFLEANQIIIAENLHASAFSDIATSRKLLKRQLQLITSSRSTILASGREVYNLPLAAGLAGARRVDPLKVIQSPVS